MVISGIILVKIIINIIPAKNWQLVRLSVVILFDRFSKTKAKALKHRTTRECVMCVHARQGRENFGCLLVLL